MDLAQFIALQASLIGGFALFAVLFVRLEGRADKLDDRISSLERSLPEQFRQLRRDLAEDLAAQRAEAARHLTAITNAILAARGER
jgi:hypothetical protein